MTRRLFPLLLILFAFPAAASVDYILSVTSILSPVDPGVRARVSAFVSQVCCRANDPTEATVTIPLPPGSTNITAPGEFGGWACSIAGTTVTCTTHLAATPPFPGIIVDFNVPSSPDGLAFRGKATLTTTVTDDHPENNLVDVVVSVYRILTVTTADDFGAGSLRDAITRANADCGTVACKMTFSGPMTIEPKSQLPAITTGMLIDGGIPLRTSLDIERPVEISGAKAGFANGLEIRTSREVSLRGITIDGFGANGLVVAELKAPPPGGVAQISIEDCFIGTNTTATEARPNGMRGIALETPFTYAYINNCTISGNRYSGIAIWGAQYVTIYGCRIGAGRGGRPLGNGASGVYADGGIVQIGTASIAYNHDFGVGVGPHAEHVSVSIENVFANGVQDFDWGLDGPTRIDPAARMPPAPVLLDAAYDGGRNVTTVRGVIPREGLTPVRFSYIYVSIFEKTGSGYQSRANAMVATRAGDADVPFSMTAQGDLRGHTLTGKSDSFIFLDSPAIDSSELSAPIEVHP